MTDIELSLTVECPHSPKKRLQVQTNPSDEVTWTVVWFRVCDRCAALALRAGFDFMGYPETGG